MAYFDRITNSRFLRDADGRSLYFPPAGVGGIRLLPSGRDELRLRSIVRVFYRYGVLLALPIVYVAYFYMQTYGQIGLNEVGMLAVLSAVLMLPAFALLHWFSCRYEIATVGPTVKADGAKDGAASLNTVLFLTIFTVVIGTMGGMAAFGLIADFLD